MLTTVVVGSNNGTTQGATFAPGEVGQAFSVTGGTYVDIPNAASLNPTTAITVDAWVNGSALDVYQAIVKKADANAGYSLEMSSYEICVLCLDQRRFCWRRVRNFASYQYLVPRSGDLCSSSTSTLAIYVNGVLESSVPLSGTRQPRIARFEFWSRPQQPRRPW